MGPSLGVLKVPVRVTEASCSVLELLWGVRGWGMELGGVCVCVYAWACWYPVVCVCSVLSVYVSLLCGGGVFVSEALGMGWGSV